MPGLLRISVVFFRPFCIVCVLLSILCCYVVLRNGETGYFILFSWLKVIVDAVMLYAWRAMKGGDVYFYHNLGMTTRSMYASVFVFDFLLFALLSTLTCCLM